MAAPSALYEPPKSILSCLSLPAVASEHLANRHRVPPGRPVGAILPFRLIAIVLRVFPYCCCGRAARARLIGHAADRTIWEDIRADAVIGHNLPLSLLELLRDGFELVVALVFDVAQIIDIR